MKKIKLERYFKKYSYDINKVMGINPLNLDEMFILENGILEKTTKFVKSDHLISTYIPNKIIITYELSVAKNLLDKIQLDEYVETKCYEDGIGLEETKEYIFKYKIIETEIDEKNVIISVYVIEKEEVAELFKPVIDKYGFFDFMPYYGFSYNVLYRDEILEPQKDMFIYFTKDEISMTLYSEGKYLQTSIITEGLESIYSTISEIESMQEISGFDYNMFVKLLTKKGLSEDNYSDREKEIFNNLSEIFSNKFLTISNHLHTLTRKYGLATIDRIFIGTSHGVIPGISIFSNMYLGTESNDLKFDTKYNPQNLEIDQLLFLSMLYARSSFRDDYQDDNFSFVKRPPTFFYRKSGQLITISFVSLLLSLAYPIYQIVESSILDELNNGMKKELSRIQHQNKKITTLKTKTEQQKNQKEQLRNNLIKYVKDKKEIIETIYKEKQMYIPKSVLIAKITNYLELNEVYLNSIIYEEFDKNKGGNKLLVLDVHSKDSGNITNFVNDLVQKEHIILFSEGLNLELPNIKNNKAVKIITTSNEEYNSIIKIKVAK